MSATTPLTKAALSLDANFTEPKDTGNGALMKPLISTLVIFSTLMLSAEASAMSPSRRRFCIAGIVGGVAAMGALFWGNIDALLTGIPRDPIQPGQLTNEGFSDDPLVNLRQKVMNLHGVRVTAVIDGPDAVTQYEFGKFLAEFLKNAGSPDEFPMMTALMPPRSVVVSNGTPTIRYESNVVNVSWKMGKQLVADQHRMHREVPALAKEIYLRTGVAFGHGAWNRGLQIVRWTVHYDEFETFLKNFDRLSAGISRETFENARMAGPPVMLIDVAEANALGLWVPDRHLDPKQLEEVINGVRAGTFRLPAPEAPRVGGPLI